MKSMKMSTTTQILLATASALVLGTILSTLSGSMPAYANIFDQIVVFINSIGQVWLRLIQMSIIILIMTAVAGAIGNIEGAGAGKISFHTFKYIIIFTIISAVIGLVLGLLIQPGVGVDLGVTEALGDVAEIGKANIFETLVNFVPTNIFTAMAANNTVQVIVFSLVFGVAAQMYGAKTGNNTVLELINSFNGVIMEIINMIMKVAPLGIFGLLTPVAANTGIEIVVAMLKFLLTLFLADVIMFLLYFPYTAFKLGVSPAKMPKKFSKMAIMALTTTSGAICLPTKMEDSVTKFGVSRRVTNFTGPITMSMNSSGAVACYVVAILFMAQASGIVMTPMDLFMGILLSIMMVMGTISVPGGSVVVYSFFASSLGLPVESIAVLIAIDWFAGAFRTIMNVTIDVLVGMLVADKMGEFDKDVYNDVKVVEYE